MSQRTRAAGATGTRLVFALSAVALAVSIGAVLALGGDPVLDRWDVHWGVFVPVYLAFSWWSLEFLRKGETTNITVTQLPLGLGLVLLGPVQHLAARLLSSVLLSAGKRRPPLKFAVNVAVDALELAAAIAVMHVARGGGGWEQPGPGLWLALIGALLVSEIVASLGLDRVFSILGIGSTGRQRLEMLFSGMATSAAFAALTVLTLAATWTDPWTLVSVALLAGALVVGYRTLRRNAAQQEVTDELHALVADLGPVDVDGQEIVPLLQRIRELLHAREGELETFSVGETAGRRITVGLDGEATIELSPAGGYAPSGLFSQDRLRAPVVANGVVIGLVTVCDRLSDRAFDPQDLRLLDTIANELATALDRGRMVKDLRLAATRDPLTGLPNLRQTAEEIDDLLSTEQIILATMSVDSFREVNDTLGHLVGDELLVEVARRIQVACPGGVVGRIGGGRFAVAITAEQAGNDPAMFGLGLRTQVEGGAQLGSISTHIRMSVGCVQGPEHGSDASTLLRRAETAMYSARNAHGGPVLWEPAYEVQGQRRLAVVMALREAISSNAVGVAYQPKVDARTGHVVGVEALARWTHPALGSILPDEFIPLAEASGLMSGLTSSVLRQALVACNGWQRRGGSIGVAVNVNSDTVLDPDFVTSVADVLRQTGTPPGLLTLELTESVVVADPALASERMQELRNLGVKLSVDDFGTGYSSLTYLKGLPIDEVKIDKGFVAGLVQDLGDQAIVRAVVDIAHTLGTRVVAEGVEQQDQRELLTRLGVDELQGYLFARPMPALGVAAWIRRHETTRETTSPAPRD